MVEKIKTHRELFKYKRENDEEMNIEKKMLKGLIANMNNEIIGEIKMNIKKSKLFKCNFNYNKWETDN